MVIASRSACLTVLLGVAAILLVACDGGGSGPATPSQAPASVSPSTTAALSYQVTYVETHDGQRVGTQVLAQDPPRRAWWQILDNGYLTGWILDTAGMLVCNGKQGGAGECFASNASGGTGAAMTRVGEATPDTGTLPGRTVAGGSTSCYAVQAPQGGDAGEVCTAGGILLYSRTANVTLEATEVRDSADASLFAPPFPIRK